MHFKSHTYIAGRVHAHVGQTKNSPRNYYQILELLPSAAVAAKPAGMQRPELFREEAVTRIIEPWGKRPRAEVPIKRERRQLQSL